MSAKDVKISKFLSYILRHNPQSLGLTVNAEGWAEIDEIIRKSQADDRDLSYATIKRVVRQSDKNRFEISNDKRFIRANYGHSIPVNLDYSPARPPSNLYHGTAATNESSIRREGIHAGGRQYVHLSPDHSSARSVGRRHGKPIILTIKARRMHEEGHVFYPTQSNVWLTEHVPPTYID